MNFLFFFSIFAVMLILVFFFDFSALPDIVRRNSHQDDSLTVASSDIEVIRNVDAWFVSSHL